MYSSYRFTVDNGFSKTIANRRRYFDIPKKDDEDYNKRMGSIRRESGNHFIQGSAAEVTKQALIYLVENIQKYKLDAKIVLVVHDEIVVECKEEQAEECKKILEQSMLDGFYFFFKKVPMIVDGYISDYWIKG